MPWWTQAASWSRTTAGAVWAWRARRAHGCVAALGCALQARSRSWPCLPHPPSLTALLSTRTPLQRHQPRRVPPPQAHAPHLRLQGYAEEGAASLQRPHQKQCLAAAAPAHLATLHTPPLAGVNVFKFNADRTRITEISGEGVSGRPVLVALLPARRVAPASQACVPPLASRSVPLRFCGRHQRDGGEGAGAGGRLPRVATQAPGVSRFLTVRMRDKPSIHQFHAMHQGLGGAGLGRRRRHATGRHGCSPAVVTYRDRHEIGSIYNLSIF